MKAKKPYLFVPLDVLYLVKRSFSSMLMVFFLCSINGPLVDALNSYVADKFLKEDGG